MLRAATDTDELTEMVYVPGREMYTASVVRGVRAGYQQLALLQEEEAQPTHTTVLAPGLTCTRGMVTAGREPYGAGAEVEKVTTAA